jgi:RNA polymerase sigma-70 factor (ECF subfamily)
VGAYEQLVQRHQQAAFRTAYFVASGADDAQDAAQEGFVKAYRALGQFRSGASFRPWLLAIVANEARNRLRSASRRDSLAMRLAESRSHGDAAPSPERAALARADREALLAAMSRLSEEDRLVIGYRFFLELSEREMAEALRCRPGTVKSRLSRAIGRLRNELRAEGVTDER